MPGQPSYARPPLRPGLPRSSDNWPATVLRTSPASTGLAPVERQLARYRPTRVPRFDRACPGRATIGPLPSYARPPLRPGLPRSCDNWPATVLHASPASTGLVPVVRQLAATVLRAPASTGLAPVRQLARYRLHASPLRPGLPRSCDNWPATVLHASPASTGLAPVVRQLARYRPTRVSRFDRACPGRATTGPLPSYTRLPLRPGLPRSCDNWPATVLHASPASTGLAPVVRQLARYRPTRVPRFDRACPGRATTGPLPSYTRLPLRPGLPRSCDNWPATVLRASPASTGLVPVVRQLARYRPTRTISAGRA